MCVCKLQLCPLIFINKASCITVNIHQNVQCVRISEVTVQTYFWLQASLHFQV